MEKKILILEDNEENARALAEIVHSVEDDCRIFLASQAAQAYGIVMEQHVHLLLVDIVLDNRQSSEVSGIDFVEKLRKIPEYRFVPVIFVSSLEDPRLYAYSELHCYSYLEKPYHMEKAKRIIAEALHLPVLDNAKKEMISFKIDGVLYCQKTADIVYLFTQNREMHIITVSETFEVPYMGCREALQMLKNSNFIQCSKGTIVNRQYIERIDVGKGIIYLRDDYGELRIGKTLKKQFMRAVQGNA